MKNEQNRSLWITQPFSFLVAFQKIVSKVRNHRNNILFNIFCSCLNWIRCQLWWVRIFPGTFSSTFYFFCSYLDWIFCFMQPFSSDSFPFFRILIRTFYASFFFWFLSFLKIELNPSSILISLKISVKKSASPLFDSSSSGDFLENNGDEVGVENSFDAKK